MGIPSQEQLTGNPPLWFHIEFPVSGYGSSLKMALLLRNVADYQIHHDHDFGAWTCTETVTQASEDTVLDCVSGTTDSGKSQDLGLDISTSSPWAYVEADLRPGWGHDPRLSNNSASVTVYNAAG